MAKKRNKPSDSEPAFWAAFLLDRPNYGFLHGGKRTEVLIDCTYPPCLAAQVYQVEADSESVAQEAQKEHPDFNVANEAGKGVHLAGENGETQVGIQPGSTAHTTSVSVTRTATWSDRLSGWLAEVTR